MRQPATCVASAPLRWRRACVLSSIGAVAGVPAGAMNAAPALFALALEVSGRRRARPARALSHDGPRRRRPAAAGQLRPFALGRLPLFALGPRATLARPRPFFFLFFSPAITTYLILHSGGMLQSASALWPKVPLS